jgi:hypothetical protein
VSTADNRYRHDQGDPLRAALGLAAVIILLGVLTGAALATETVAFGLHCDRELGQRIQAGPVCLFPPGAILTFERNIEWNSTVRANLKRTTSARRERVLGPFRLAHRLFLATIVAALVLAIVLTVLGQRVRVTQKPTLYGDRRWATLDDLKTKGIVIGNRPNLARRLLRLAADAVLDVRDFVLFRIACDIYPLRVELHHIMTPVRARAISPLQSAIARLLAPARRFLRYVDSLDRR